MHKVFTYKSTVIPDETIEYIRDNYPIVKNSDLIKVTGINSSTLVRIQKYYSLKKDIEWLKNIKSEILTERNKRLGRDMTPELVKEIALLFNTKTEFQYKDPSAYSSANRFGIMEDVTKHMINPAFSVPQIITRQITEYLFNQKCMYNTRKIIAPYELDIYFPELKLAFEYDGKGWHQNDELDKVELCRSKEILLIKLFERSRRYEEDIKNHLLDNLYIINNWCNFSITENQINSFSEPIDFPILFSEDELLLLRSSSTKFLRKNHNLLYERYKRYNPDNIEFKNRHIEATNWKEEDILAILQKYTSVKELLSKEPNVYLAISRRFRNLLPLYGTSRDKKVICVETSEEFKSASEAGRVLGIPRSCIDRVCRGERNHTHGKTFKYIDK